MALNTYEMWSNGIKIAFVTKNCLASDPRLWYAWVALLYATRLPIHYFSSFGLSPLLSKILVKCHHTGYDFWSSILRWLCPTKVPFSKISDHVIVCDFWFGPPSLSKILATPVVRLQICSFFSHLYSISLIYVTECISMNWKGEIKEHSSLVFRSLGPWISATKCPTDSQR